jgi:hypothetical protein
MIFGLALHHAASAALLISEVLYNEVGSDVGGEWIEIFNNGTNSVDLSSFKVGDEETSGATGATEAMFQFPAGASIPAAGVQIIATNAATFFTNYGFKPTYEVIEGDATVPNMTVYNAWDPDGNTLNMSNTNDQALLLDGSDALVDAVSWGGAFAFDPPLNADGEADGQSYERINGYSDTNTASDWRLSNPSSPGVVVVPEPGTLIMVLFAGCFFPRRRPTRCTI